MIITQLRINIILCFWCHMKAPPVGYLMVPSTLYCSSLIRYKTNGSHIIVSGIALLWRRTKAYIRTAFIQAPEEARNNNLISHHGIPSPYE